MKAKNNFNITFGKLNEDNSKAVYITNQDGQRLFAFWYCPTTDNPHDLKPKQAVIELIQNAGYHDVADFFNTKFYLQHR